jgi:hypothetical protein
VKSTGISCEEVFSSGFDNISDLSGWLLRDPNMLHITKCYFRTLVLDAGIRAWSYSGTLVIVYRRCCNWQLSSHNTSSRLNDRDQPSGRDFDDHQGKESILTRDLKLKGFYY